jgi:hypothetical protein
MNIDFSKHAGFSIYVILLMLSGITMVLFGSALARRSSAFGRALSVLAGLGFFGYGFYLAFIFSGGHYVIFFYAFAVPVVMIIRAITGSATARRNVQPPASYPMAYPAPGYYSQPYPTLSTGQPYFVPSQPDRAYPGQAYPGQAYPGQAYPGQPSPAPQYAVAPINAPAPPKPTMPVWPPTA